MDIKNPVQLRLIYEAAPGQVEIYRNGKLYHLRRVSGLNHFAFKAMVPGFYTIHPKPKEIKPEAMQKRKTGPLPPPDRNQKKRVTIRVNNTLAGTPARIFPATGVIEVGAEFNKLPEQAKLFILLHELGHLYYTREEDADLFALVKFNEMGGNASQSIYTLHGFLTPTPENRARLNSLFKHAKKL